MLAAVLCLTAFLAGCVSIPFEEGNAPAREGRFNGEYEDFAVCLVVNWNKKLGRAVAKVIAVDRKDSTAYVAIGASQTTVRQVEPEVVLVQRWATPTLFPPPAWVWEMVEACAEDGPAS